MNQKVRKNIIQTIYETFGSIKDIKIFNQENNVKKYFDSNIAEFEKNNFHFVIFSKLPRILGSFIHCRNNYNFIFLFNLFAK